MLNINKIQEGSKLIIELEGKMDAVTAPSLGKVVESELSGVTELVFDLKNLEYTSSAGLRQFLAAQQIMDAQGSMVIKNVNEAVMDIFDETYFSNIFKIE
jgi:anti-sigma B factor antagonist